MNHQQIDRREFNSGALAVASATTAMNPIASAFPNRSSLDSLVFPHTSGIMNMAMSSPAADQMCRKIVLNECADLLVRNPDSIKPSYWREQMQTFEEMGGIPESFPELLRHAINKPGKFAHDSLVSCSPEAKHFATERVEEISRLPAQKKELGQSLRNLETALGRRLDLMYWLHEADSVSFRKPIAEASI